MYVCRGAITISVYPSTISHVQRILALILHSAIWVHFVHFSSSFFPVSEKKKPEQQRQRETRLIPANCNFEPFQVKYFFFFFSSPFPPSSFICQIASTLLHLFLPFFLPPLPPPFFLGFLKMVFRANSLAIRVTNYSSCSSLTSLLNHRINPDGSMLPA